MDYDFALFLIESSIGCKTKADFIHRINNEVALVSKISDAERYIERQLYLRRLENALFCIQKGAIKEKDIYNADLEELLDRLT